ncbi:MAG: recombinase family protein [Candidatus Scalinduaceae bacterium]
MNCLLYARVSTDKQAQKDLSIPAQIEAMREYAKRNSWKVVGHYVDEGESATTANRPELKNLIQHCKGNKGVDIVIVHKIDRLARNLIDYATIKAVLKQKGIKLASVTEPFDDNPVGHLLENIIASISEWYSANLGEEIKKSNLAKLKKGEWPHKPPIGYKSIKGEDGRSKHLPDQKTVPLVRQAFELFSTGNYSLNTLAEEMHSRGLKTRYGRIYSPELMKKLLTKRFYISRLVWQGKEYKGIHKAIIPKDLFYRVQEVLKKRSVDTGEKGKLEFLLRGITYCQFCNRKLTGEIHPRGSYYRCLPNIHKEKCSQPYTPVKLLDSQLEALYERLQPSKKLLELLKVEMQEIAKKRKKIAQKEIKNSKKIIEDLEDKEIKLLDEMLEGKVRRDIYERMDKKYTEKKKEAESRLSQLEVDYDDPLDFLDKCITVASMLLYLHQRFNYEQRKNLIKAVFDKIYVQNKAIVDVKLNSPFSFLLKEDIGRVFENHPTGVTKEDVFEQIINFTLSEQYMVIKGLVESLVGKR